MLLSVLFACARPSPEPWPWPEALGPAPVPADNPMDPLKVELGRALFFDPRLSADGSASCASCHDPALAYADGKAVPEGVFGDPLPRSAPPLVNLAWSSTLTWSSPLLTTLEDQAVVPLFGQVPPELAFDHVYRERLPELGREPLAVLVWGGTFGVPELLRSLAAFERTLISVDSAWDRGTLTPSQAAAEAVFERVGCPECHPAPFFTVAVAGSDADAYAALGDTGSGLGLYEFTRDPADLGRYRVPTLREVGRTGPYLHDGAAPTLAAAIRAHEGSPDPRLAGLALTPDEVDALVDLLGALSGE